MQYVLRIGAGGVAPPDPATAVLWSGSQPIDATVGIPTSVFSVTTNGWRDSSFVVTPSSSVSGTFSPSSVTMPVGNPAVRTFSFTASAAGSASISLANDGGLSNPSPTILTIITNPAADRVTLTGPTSGTVGVASSTFSVGVNGSLTGSVIVTPATTGGGTFTPTTVTIPAGTTPAAQTFTYTPASSGAKSITLTNNGGLTNPAAWAFTAGAGGVAGYSISGPSTATENVAATYTVTLNAVRGSTTRITLAAAPDGFFYPLAPEATDTWAYGLYIEIPAGQTVGQFDFYPATSGANTITPTNNAGLTNPAQVNITVAPYLPQVAGGITWNNVAMTPGAQGVTFVVASPFAGTKHLRWAHRSGHASSDDKWYMLGGDYNNVPTGSGGQYLYRVSATNASSPLAVEAELNGPWTYGTPEGNYWPTDTGRVIPARVDEAPWMYDSTRDRFLLYPYPRWTGATASHVRVGHLMFYYPATNTWADQGTVPWASGVDNQLDPLGRAYPTETRTAKWGVYDETTDRYYIPLNNSQLLVLEADDLTIAEWPIKSYGDASPFHTYHAVFNEACLCFDKVRRRLVSLRRKVSDPADPNGMQLWYVGIDPVAGTRPHGFVPATNAAINPLAPIQPNLEALVHDEASDQYLLISGAWNPLADFYYANEYLNEVRAIPAAGGTWREYLATSSTLPKMFGPSVEFDPTAGKFFMYGGNGAPDPIVRWLTINPPQPTWRVGQTALTWKQFGNAANTVDPKANAALNPNGAGNRAPWTQTASGITNGEFEMLWQAWSGGAYDEVTGTFWKHGGGHADYAGNEVLSLNVFADSPAWTLRRAPTGAIGNTGTLDDAGEASNQYFDGRPRSIHSYDCLAAVNGDLWVMGQPAPFRTAISTYSCAFRFNGGTNDWTRLQQGVTPSAGPFFGTGTTCHDTLRNRIYGWGNNATYPSYWNVTTQTAGTDTSFQPNIQATEGTLLYLPEFDVQVYLYAPYSGGFGVADYGRTGGGFVNTPGATGTAPSYPTIPYNSRFYANGVWVPSYGARGAIICWHGGTSLWVLQPPASGNVASNAWAWSMLAADGANVVDPGAVIPNGMYGNVFYSPRLNGVFVSKSHSAATYFFALS